jgi:hypothetical protein
MGWQFLARSRLINGPLDFLTPFIKRDPLGIPVHEQYFARVKADGLRDAPGQFARRPR